MLGFDPLPLPFPSRVVGRNKFRSGEHREKFPPAYKEQMPVDAIGYLPKLIRYACVEIGGPVTMNGRFYVSDEDIVDRAAFLRILWEKLVDAIYYWEWMEGPARTKYLMMVRNGLLIAFDNAYVEFEKAYVSFMIAVEESCKSILSYGNSLVAKFRNGNTEAHEDFVELLRKMYNINPEANIDGKDLQDLDSSIYINAKKMLQAGILPAMCGRVHGSLFDPGGGLGRQEVQAGQILEGSFSTVSKPIFAIRYSLVTRRSAKWRKSRTNEKQVAKKQFLRSVDVQMSRRKITLRYQ